MSTSTIRAINFVCGVFLGFTLTLAAQPAVAAPGETITTPQVITELPIEVETEVGPAGSLKIIPLWKETVELLEDPLAEDCPFEDDPLTQTDESSRCFADTERRPFFEPGTGIETDNMPRLRTIAQCHNVLTGQPLRRRPDGEIDWNQPGFLFDPDEVVPVEDPSENNGLVSNIPAVLRTPIGSLVACPEMSGPPENACLGAPFGSLVVNNPTTANARNVYGFGGNQAGDGLSDDRIPPHGTVVAEAACDRAGRLRDEDDGSVVRELEQPVNENHFFKDRLAAEVLGKALFWDMQVGSDGVQACGSCHAFAGVDHRTRNQLNPNTMGGDLVLDVHGPATIQDTNQIDVVAADFPFHKRVDPDAVGDGFDLAVLVSDSDDVMSSMGVSEFRQFEDILVGSVGNIFHPAVQGVRALRPDIGTVFPDPIAVMNGNRRIEPRNTPTMHAAAFNFDNFWDGRARHDYNGGSVFGPADPFFHVYMACGPGENGTGLPHTLRVMAAPDEAEAEVKGALCNWSEEGGNYLGVDDGEEPVPVRIRFSSLASQAMGPPLSDFEMAFGFVDADVRGGRNWAKIGKKLLHGNRNPRANRKVTPLAKQLVDVNDSRLGPWSNQGGSECLDRGRPTAVGKPGLCTTYKELVAFAFKNELWNEPSGLDQHVAGTEVPMNNDCDPGEQIHELGIQATCDPFDGYVLEIADGSARRNNTNQFDLAQANFSLFFGLAIQAYEQLLIPDHTPWDQFNDLYPGIGNGVAQPGEQGTLPPSVIRELVTGSSDPNVTLDVGLVEGMDEDILYGFDIFAGGNLTAALPVGSPRNPQAVNQATNEPLVDEDGNPVGVGSNPFLRSARCMLCHLGPEQTDHTNNVNAGLLQSGTEIEFPFPQAEPEPTGILRVVTGMGLAEELEENAQDGVEVENRNFLLFGEDFTTIYNSTVAPPSGIAFQDNGIYNIGVRPTGNDMLRGADDPFGFPLALSALALKNVGGVDFEPCDTETEAAADPASCNLPNFDPDLGVGGGLYETVGDCAGCDFEGTGYYQESINPGLDLEPEDPQLPEYLAEWANNLPAGEANPFIDELAFAPNTITENSVSEYTEIIFGADVHCGVFDTVAFGAEAPNWGWGPLCPNNQTGVPTNMKLGDGPFVPGSLVAPPNGTWGSPTAFPNRVARNGAAKVPQLRNVELTGPYFHTGSYLTLRQVVDFYIRGGDFPVTNREDRDPNLVDVTRQAFGFGATTGLDPLFLDGIPDVVTQYNTMPDIFPPGCIPEDGFPNGPNCTPEPATSTPEQAKVALVKFLLALTDERVAHRSAPFDQPEIFVPIDGKAPANDGGVPQLVTLSSAPCPDAGSVEAECFLRIPATGRTGQAERLPAFLGVSRIEGDPGWDHFDR